jgi:hypothetical protein
VESAFVSAKALVEKVIEGLGVDPAAVRVPDRVPDPHATRDHGLGPGPQPARDQVNTPEEHANWTLQRGSAQILVSVVRRKEDGGGVHLRVIAPLITLPEASKREALYKRVLELNAAGLGNAAFGLVNDRLVVVSERPAAGMDAGELNQIIRHLAAVADTYDNRLVKDFGGRLASEKS